MSGDKPARYRLTFALDVPADLVAVQEVDPTALDAAEAIIDDLAHGRVRASYSVNGTSAATSRGLHGSSSTPEQAAATISIDIPASR